MPDKPATVAAYAAAASLAAITFFYVIGPNYLLDGDSRESPNDYDPNDPDAAVSGGGGAGGGLFSRNGRKHTIVGLINDANDCFMNSTLQALAPLYDLRLYLIRELHRREADGREIYESLIVPEKNDDAASSSTTTTTTTTGRRAAVGGRGTRRDPTAALLSLQRAPVTRALKQMLDALNERPIYRKTTTIQPFVTALERAFQAGINRNQQDAQEFLQIVLERVWEEYKAGERVREEAKRRGILPRNSVVATVVGNGDDVRQQENVYVNGNTKNHAQPPTQPPPQTETDTETDSSLLFEPEAPAAIPFPFLGKLSSQVECRVCGYLPKPKTTTFVNLTLQIPQHKGSATLGSCLDTLLMTEYIDDYRCDQCALMHVLEERQRSLHSSTRSDSRKQVIEQEIAAIQHSLSTDPENLPEGINFSSAPKRQIARTTRIVEYPRILAIHLSRSIYGAGYAYSTKNATKVSFPETLKLGRTLLSRDAEQRYRLVSIVCHKGSSHNSGHYESMRRCVVREPSAARVNEEVWRWVGSRSRSRAVSCAASAAGVENVGAVNGVNGVSGRIGAVDEAKEMSAAPEPSSVSNAQDNVHLDTSTASPSRATSTATSKSAFSRTETMTSTAPSLSVVHDSSDNANSASENDKPQSQSQSRPQELPTKTDPLQPQPTQDETTDQTFPPSDEFIDESSLHRTTTRLLNRVSRTTTANTGAAPSSARTSKSKERREKKQRKQGRSGGKVRSDKWFRVSDEKVKQCKTSDVLGMQKEVYLLFYEMEE